jgi:nucleoside-diphosphate-sugar epimerase
MINSIVFGSGGFLGKHLVKRLKKEGHQVWEIHRNEDYDIKEVDYIFYLSSYGNHYIQTDKYETIKANILNYYELLNHTKSINYKQLIHFSTSSVNLPVQTTYSESKYIAELLGSIYADKYNKNIISIRPYSVYGEGEANFRFIPKLIHSLKYNLSFSLSDGWHDWIYIEDFIDALMTIVDLSKPEQSIEIGTGIQSSNSMVVSLLERISGKKIKIIDGENRIYDTNNWVADPSYLNLIGWKPKYTLEDGLTKVWEYYQKYE